MKASVPGMFEWGGQTGIRAGELGKGISGAGKRGQLPGKSQLSGMPGEGTVTRAVCL